MSTTVRLLLLFFILSTNVWSTPAASPWYTYDNQKQVQVNVELFLSSTCPHCHSADAFFHDLEVTTPWLHVQRYIINQDKNALVRFNQLLIEQKMSDFAVPSVFFCNSRWVGFASPKTTGKDLVQAIHYCKQQIEKKSELTKTTVSVLKRMANASLFNSGMTETPSTFRYLITIALMDAFNPCALFCLAGFFALLVIQNKRMAVLCSGLLYILAVGLVHYIQQTHLNAFFEFLSWVRVPAVLLGACTLFFTAQYYKHRPLTSSLWLILIFLLAFTVQLYQQTCLMNWSYIFEQWLNNQTFSKNQRTLVQLSYQLLYSVPLMLALMFYISVLDLAVYNRFKARLISVGLLIFVTIGLILIIYPLALSYYFLSVFIITLLIIGSYFFKYKESR